MPVSLTWEKKTGVYVHLHPHESHVTVSLGSGAKHYSNRVIMLYTCLTNPHCTCYTLLLICSLLSETYPLPVGTSWSVNISSGIRATGSNKTSYWCYKCSLITEVLKLNSSAKGIFWWTLFVHLAHIISCCDMSWSSRLCCGMNSTCFTLSFIITECLPLCPGIDFALDCSVECDKDWWLAACAKQAVQVFISHGFPHWLQCMVYCMLVNGRELMSSRYRPRSACNLLLFRSVLHYDDGWLNKKHCWHWGNVFACLLNVYGRIL